MSPQPVQRSARHLTTNLWRLLAVPLLLFIFLPILALFLRTPLETLLANLNKAQIVQAISLSFITSIATTLVTLLLGTPVALLLTHREMRFSRVIDTLVDLPTVLPPSVAGIALLMAFGRKGLFGEFFTALDITIPFTMIAVIMAQTFVASSYYVRAAAIGFSAIDSELKQAAALDGANRWQIFRHITLPIAWSSLLSGSVMTWARALGEFGATIIFAGNYPGRTQTMPLAIYIGFEINLDVALTLSVIMICLSFLTMIVVKGFLHQRMEPAPEPSVRISL
jgi:molybdate transport system permease protein